MKSYSGNVPQHNVVAEESGGFNINSEYCWHVDPIDGTVNYSQGIPLCAVSIGLELNSKIILESYTILSRENFSMLQREVVLF